MYNFIGQVSYPVFIACVFVFFILVSIFSFIVGVGLALRSARMFRFFDFMNKRVSTRKLLKPLAAPYYIEPVVLKHPGILGTGILAGALVSLWLLREVDDIVFQPIYSGTFSIQTADILARYTHSFLMVGNALCVVLGLVLLFYPEKLTVIGRHTDKWLTFRQRTKPLHVSYFDTDKWVMSNATVAGVTLSLTSLLLGIWMYMRL
jgi:hypothetical protein